MASSTFQHNNHSPSTVIRFFKIVLKKSLQDGTLKVPKKFCKKYGDDLLNPVYLKPPDGTEWKIDWTKKDGEILFEKGWKELATYYSLDNGHLLWFEYDGTSKIEVHIFDMSGLEIDYPSNDHISGDDSVGILNKEQSRKRKEVKEESEPSSPYRSKRLKRSPNKQNQKQHVNNEEDSQSEETQHTKPVNRCKTRYVKDFFPGTSGFQALNEAQRFNSRNPFFIVKTRQANLSRTKVSFDASFFRKYFNKEQNVQIRFQGKLLSAKLQCYPYLTQAVMTSGWGLFARESKLQPGDVIIFELIKREVPTFDVHIYRAQAFEPGAVGLQFPIETRTFRCPKEFKNFESENPSFIIKITRNGLLRARAGIPASFFKKYFEKKEAYVEIRFDSKFWPAKLRCYTSNAYISSGWRAFAIDNKLKAGDVCIFELVKDAMLDVHIHRAEA
ncbi:hypothetical protein PIB30_034063 [Stylosanthes scabra]|uniref:TF-B3 domain-containing protein n=1 Tax=Stylosanthes scabra TaxID=79078 RepID=A0ABU6Z9M6_9FABA|nr:hypothetical protein [Stylosanthes scabra]